MIYISLYVFRFICLFFLSSRHFCVFYIFYFSIAIVHILKLEIYTVIRSVVKYQRNQLYTSVLLHQLIFGVYCLSSSATTQSYGTINTKLRYHQHKATVPSTRSYGTINAKLRYHQHKATVPSFWL
jgi:hypothetical protein